MDACVYEIVMQGRETMGKVLGSWSGMRKYLEKEMLADCLKNRVRYDCTRYVGMDGCHIFRIILDDKPYKSFSLETVNTYFIENGNKTNSDPYGIDQYWKEFWKLIEEISLTERSEYTDKKFCDALDLYRNQDIKKSVESENPLVVMFALLDRRIGKRTLNSLIGKIDSYPEWLSHIFKIRIDAENKKPSPKYGEGGLRQQLG